jgi:hypothetical protein
MMAAMNLLLRAGRAYWRLNERIWNWMRPAQKPLVGLAAVGSLLLWARGLSTGAPWELWAPAVMGVIWFAANMIARTP